MPSVRRSSAVIAADADVRELPGGLGDFGLPAECRQRQDERGNLLLRHTTLERDALDQMIFQPLDEFGHAQAGLGHRRVSDDELRADDADGDRRLRRMEHLEHGKQALDVSPDERVIGGIELRRAHAGGEAAEQLVVLADARLNVGHDFRSYRSLLPATSYWLLATSLPLAVSSYQLPGSQSSA